MSKARLVITAVVVQKRSPLEVATAYGVSRSWVYELLARYRAEGEVAFLEDKITNSIAAGHKVITRPVPKFA